jgi:hypothetical protein
MDKECGRAHARAHTEIQIWIKLAFLPFLWKNFSIHNQTSSESDFQCRLCVYVRARVYKNTDLD